MGDLSSLRLPVGMRDFTPDAAAARRYLAESLIGVFERWGFAQVITPAFEYEGVLARGLGASGRDATLRFVEPSSGQVLALRPDITPQVARLMATRFAAEPGPMRLCYEGPVFRYDAQARAQKELIQAGVELAGVGVPAGDAEVIELSVAALAAVGLPDPTIDLAHLGLANEVMDGLGLPDKLLPRFRKRVRRRDVVGVRELLREARGPRKVIAFAALLPELAGGPAVLAQGLEQAPSAGIRNALTALSEVVAALEKRQLRARLHVDLGEIRGFDYYTGVRFQAFVEGAAEAVAGGGRYDDLLGRYGKARPAVGFAIDVEAIASALEARGATPWSARNGGGGVLVVGPPDAAAREAARLRAEGVRCAVFPDNGAGANGKKATKGRAAVRKPGAPDEARAYAARWGYSDLSIVGAREPRAVRAASRPRRSASR